MSRLKPGPISEEATARTANATAQRQRKQVLRLWRRMTNKRTDNGKCGGFGGLTAYIPIHDGEACHGWGTRSLERVEERQRQKQQHSWLNGSIGLGETGNIGVLRLRCAALRMTALWGGWSCTTSEEGNPPFPMKPERMGHPAISANYEKGNPPFSDEPERIGHPAVFG